MGGVSRRLGLVSGWPWDIIRGSGTARFLQDLTRALTLQGASIVPIDPGLDPTDYPTFVHRRLAWNRSLADEPRLRGLDALLVLDYDGRDLPPPPAAPPKIVCPQAVFARLAETEPEPFRSHLLVQAEAEAVNLRSAQSIITPSRYAARLITRHYGVKAGRIHVVPHGFDSSAWPAFPPWKEPRQGGGPTILTVAKLYPRKRVDLVIEAAAVLRGEFPSMRLVIVGDGPEEEQLQDLAHGLGLSDAVRFEGNITDRSDLAACYRDADLFCLPSEHETFGFVFLEAMNAGLPVLAARAGAAREVLGAAGRLVPPGDAGALADAMREILNGSKLRRRMIERGRETVSRFSWKVTARRYMEIVEDVLGSHPGARGAEGS